MPRIVGALASVAALFFVVAAPSAALAGACPVCTSHADCEALTGFGSVCVEWDRDFGCGAQRITCCPGQGCALDSPGVPSCLGDGCVLFGGAADGGTPDQGAIADFGVAPDAALPGDVGGTPDASGPGDAAAGLDASGTADTGTRTSTMTGVRPKPGGGGGDSPGQRDRDAGCSCSMTADGPLGVPIGLGLMLGGLLGGRAFGRRRRR